MPRPVRVPLLYILPAALLVAACGPAADPGAAAPVTAPAISTAAAPAVAPPAASRRGPPIPFRIKTAPPGAAVYLDGRELGLRPLALDGFRGGQVPSGGLELILLAEGHVARKLLVPEAKHRLILEEKLERAASGLELLGFAETGRAPKSLYYSPDGSLIVAPLLANRGADIFDARSLEPLGRFEPPPAEAASLGFVEALFLPKRDEVWISQMHNSRIQVFRASRPAWKESFPSGGSYPKILVASPDGGTVYVSNWVSEEVTALDAASRKLLWRVRVGGTPRGLAPSADGRHLYIARFEGGSILRLDLATRSLETWAAADGGAKRHLVLDEGRDRLYATDMHRGSLFVYELASGRVLAEIPLGDNPNGCALSPGGSLVFACTRGPNGSRGYEQPGPVAGELLVVDAESLRVVDRQWGGNQPTGLAVSPDGGTVVFSDFLDDRIEAYKVGPPLRPAGPSPGSARR